MLRLVAVPIGASAMLPMFVVYGLKLVYHSRLIGTVSSLGIDVYSMYDQRLEGILTAQQRRRRHELGRRESCKRLRERR